MTLEPYVYGEAALEGHFLYRHLADQGGVVQETDADYRFTQLELELGIGVDAYLRAGLEVWDKSIVGYPSRDRDDFLELRS